MDKYISPLGDWNELEKELFTPEETEESNRWAALIGDLIAMRDAKRITRQEYMAAMAELDAAMEKDFDVFELSAEMFLPSSVRVR